MSALRNLAGILGAPLVPPLLLLRRVQNLVARRKRLGRLLLSLPWMALYDAAWAVGEALGHLEALTGSGARPGGVPTPKPRSASSR